MGTKPTMTVLPGLCQTQRLNVPGEEGGGALTPYKEKEGEDINGQSA